MKSRLVAHQVFKTDKQGHLDVRQRCYLHNIELIGLPEDNDGYPYTRPELYIRHIGMLPALKGGVLTKYSAIRTARD